ncbi:MAG TPA: hypothetical protein VJH88_03455 [Candidatus Nanoarchaeia archaeon]|nr:hypothetical protein [Candidatus Nanoarchaeia archaeon]
MTLPEDDLDEYIAEATRKFNLKPLPDNIPVKGSYKPAPASKQSFRSASKPLYNTFLSDGLREIQQRRPQPARKTGVSTAAKTGIDDTIERELADEDKELTDGALHDMVRSTRSDVVLQVAYHQIPVDGRYSSITYSLFGDRRLTVSGSNGTMEGEFVGGAFPHILDIAENAFKLVKATRLERFGDPTTTEGIYVETSFGSLDTSCNFDFGPTNNAERQAFHHVLRLGYQLQRGAVLSLGRTLEKAYMHEVVAINRELSSRVDR